jgi:hypothetical protein
MNELVKTILPSLIALAGTLTAAILGYVIWRRQQSQVRSGTFLNEKQAVYRQAWEKLEEVHLYVRGDHVDRTRLLDLIREANAYLLKSEPLLNKGEYQRSNVYLGELRELGAYLATLAENTPAGVREEIYTTAEVAPAVSADVKELVQRLERVKQARADLLEQFSSIMRAHK